MYPSSLKALQRLQVVQYDIYEQFFVTVSKSNDRSQRMQHAS